MDPGTDVDIIFETLGRFGNYQKLQLFLINLMVFQNTFHLISAVYIGYRPSFRCEDINTTLYTNERNLNESDEVTVQYNKCEMDISVNVTGNEFHFKETCLNGYRYSKPRDQSTVTEWDLVCEGAERSEFAQTLIMMGQALGAAIFAPLADRLGRKPCNVTARILYFFTALATVFAPNITVFSILRLLQGTFQGGSVMTDTILSIELLPKAARHRTNAMSSIAWTSGLVTVTLIGYLCRNMSWRYMQLILALMSINSLFDWLILDESLRWLIANGKLKQAEKQLRKACRMNNVRYETVIEKISLSKETNFTSKLEDDSIATISFNSIRQEKPKVEKYSVSTILKHRWILVSSIILWFSWITNTLTYYGLMLTTSKLFGNRYLNNILASVAEYPTMIVIQLLVNRIGRKKTLILFHGIAGVSLVPATVCNSFKDEYSWLPNLGTAFSFVGRFGITGSFNTVFLYTPECYPTNMRNVGLGVASFVSRIGSMISPFAITLADHISWGPAVVFATMNLIVTISLLVLPETMGRELPTTLAELKIWYKKEDKTTNSNIVNKTTIDTKL